MICKFKRYFNTPFKRTIKREYIFNGYKNAIKHLFKCDKKRSNAFINPFFFFEETD